MRTLNGFSLSEDEKRLFINKYQPFYYIKDSYPEDEKTLLGTIIKNKTEESVEKYAERVLDQQAVDKRIFLWKAGRLSPKDADLDSSIDKVKVQNARGHEIENAELFINEVKKMKLSKGIDGFSLDYKAILDLSKQTKLKNAGPVYLITVLFFLSNGEYPIYDYFAHRAVKALYLKKEPISVFVGGAPEKTELDKVVAMYREYLYLLEKVFGDYKIGRDLDRALWVYGHAKKSFL